MPQQRNGRETFLCFTGINRLVLVDNCTIWVANPQKLKTKDIAVSESVLALSSGTTDL